MGGVNGIVKFSVVDSPGVPPLTPVSLLKQVGAVIDLNSNTMDLKKIETTTTLRALPSGHVAHKLTEFALGGWKAPTPEQTELFQVRTDVFRPVTLPVEFKPRSSKQCASPSHHQHDPDQCVDDTMSSDLLSDDQLAQGTSHFECSYASGFDVDANSAMGKLCAGRRSLVAKTCSAVPGSRHPSNVADRAGLVATSLLKNRSNRVHTFAGTPGPSRQGERKEERYHHDQPESHTDCRGCLFSNRELHVFNTASGPILRCRGWSLAGTPCTLIEACHDGAVVAGVLRSTNRAGGGSSASGSGGPGTLPKRDDGTLDPPPINDWTAQLQALAANPAWAEEQFAQWQLLHQKYISIFNINSSSWRRRQRILGKCFSRTADPLGTGGVWTRERIGA